MNEEMLIINFNEENWNLDLVEQETKNYNYGPLEMDSFTSNYETE